MPKFRGEASAAIVISAFGNSLLPFSSLVVAPFLALGLGVSGRGELAASTAPLILATSLGTLGLPESLTYFVARTPFALTRLARLSVVAIAGAGLVLTVLIFLVAPALGDNSSPLVQLIRLAAIATAPTLMLSAVRGVAAGNRAWGRITLERAISGFARIVGIVSLYFFHSLTPLSATVCIAATYFIGLLGYIGMERTTNTEPVPGDIPNLRGVLRYGTSFWFGSLSGVILSRIDQTLMTPLSGTFQLGLYAVAVNLSEVILIFNSAVRDVMFALESSKNDHVRLSQSSRVSTLATIIAAIAVAGISPIIVPVLFGHGFIESIPVIFVLLVGIVVGNPGSVAGIGLSARGKPGLKSISLGIACSINVMMLVLLLPMYGAMGAAVATLVGNLLAGFLNTYWLRRYFGLPIKDFYLLRLSDFALLRNATLGLFKR